MDEAGNGKWSPTGRKPHDSSALADHGRQIRHDAEALAATVRDATDGLQGYVSAQVTQRPFSILGAAAGVGYLLGGGFSSRLTVVLVSAVTRVATALIARELGARILQSGSAFSSEQDFLRTLREPPRRDHAH